MKRILLIFTILAFSLYAGAQSLTFNVRTVTDGGTFTPNHVLAVWIETDAGSFVKSNKVMAASKKQYLYTWNTKSGGDETDATTGETLTAHETHTITWNCQNLSDQVVPDGDYKIWIEFTDQHAQGPIYSVSFTVSSSTFNVDPVDQTYFKDMSLDYDPTASGIENIVGNQSLSVYPNPARDILYIQFQTEENGAVDLQLIDLSGRVMQQKQLTKSDLSNYQLEVSDILKGIYILKLTVNKKEIKQKIIIQ